MNIEERNLELHIKCNICGEITVVRVREQDYNLYLSPNRPYVQDIFPYLTPAERELIISQTCDKCWKEMFSFDEEEVSE